MSNFSEVGRLYKHFGLPSREDETVPHLLEDKTANFRLKFLHEELIELHKAYEDNDLVEIADALIDIAVVAMGTAHLHGLPWEELFEEVQRSNMEKVRVTSPEQSKRGSSIDLMKPEGWKKPNLGKILKGHGWNVYKEDE